MPRKYGAGSVHPQKRNGQLTGKWVGQWSAGSDGQGRIRGTVTADSEAAAWKAMASARARSSSTRRKRGGETVGEFLERWLDDVVKATRRERTYWGYRSIVAHHLAPAFGTRPLRALSRREVQVWVGKHPRSPLTVRHHVDCLRAAMSYAVKWGFLETNPAKGLDLPTVKRRDIRAVDEDDASALLADFDGHWLAPMVTVALYTGLRQGELLALRWEDVNLGRAHVDNRGSVGQRSDPRVHLRSSEANDGGGTGASLTVHNSLARLPGPRGTRYVLDAPKSAKSRRTVPLIPDAAEALRAIRSAQMHSDIANPAGLVFGRVRDGRLVPHDGTKITSAFQARLREVGRPVMRFHDLRHGTASMLIAAGVPLSVVSDLLGHSGIAITNDTYGHLSQQVKRDAMSRLRGRVVRIEREEVAR